MNMSTIILFSTDKKILNSTLKNWFEENKSSVPSKAKSSISASHLVI